MLSSYLEDRLRSWAFTNILDVQVGDVVQGHGRILDIEYFPLYTRISFARRHIDVDLRAKIEVYAFTRTEHHEHG